VSSRTSPTLLLLTTLLCSGVALAEAPLSDPMQPPGEAGIGRAAAGGKAAKKSSYHLSAIRIRKESRSATINGKTVTVGEHIGAARIVAISAANVTLKQNGRAVTIPLLPLSIKTPVEAKQP
jgi:hypothetical protein